MRNNVRGVTLIELLIVVSLFAVVVVMAIPQLQSTLAGDRLLTSRDNLAAELEMARIMAVSRNATYEFRVDTSAGTYQIIDFEDPGNPPRSQKQLDPGVSFGNVPVSQIRFFARGHSTGGSLVLVSATGNLCALTVNQSGHVGVGDIRAYETQ